MTCKKFHLLFKSKFLWTLKLKYDYDIVYNDSTLNSTRLYELFYMAQVLRFEQLQYKPVSHIKVSLLVWYLIFKAAPTSFVKVLTLSQAKNIWGLNFEDIKNHHINYPNVYDYFINTPRFTHYYLWSSLYDAYLSKHGSIFKMQESIIKRCLRSKKSLENEFKIYIYHKKQIRSLKFRYFRVVEVRIPLFDYENYMNILKMINKTLSTSINKILAKYHDIFEDYSDFTNYNEHSHKSLISNSSHVSAYFQHVMPDNYRMSHEWNFLGNSTINQHQFKHIYHYCVRKFMDYLRDIIHNFNLFHLINILKINAYENDVENYMYTYIQLVPIEQLPSLSSSNRTNHPDKLFNNSSELPAPNNFESTSQQQSSIFNYHLIFDQPLQNILLYLQRIYLIWSSNSQIIPYNCFLLKYPYRLILFK